MGRGGGHNAEVQATNVQECESVQKEGSPWKVLPSRPCSKDLHRSLFSGAVGGEGMGRKEPGRLMALALAGGGWGGLTPPWGTGTETAGPATPRWPAWIGFAIWGAWSPLRARFRCRTASFIRSTSCWYLKHGRS